MPIEPGDPRYAEVDRWIEAAYGSDPKIQFSAANKLRRLGDPRSTGALVHILETSSMGVALARTAALLPLRAWRRLDAVPVLIEALDPAREDRDALPPDVVAVALDDITHRSAGLSHVERNLVRAGGVESKRAWLAWWAENEQRLRKELGQAR